MTTELTTVTVASPLGPLRLYASGAGLCGVFFEDHRPAPGPRFAGAVPARVPFDAVASQLGEYFAGTRLAFELDLDPVGTPFQRGVWEALCAIPAGQTISYRTLAARVGRPTAVRAVAAANARNPLSIVVPCHRVIGADGALTGYAGGLDRKRRLLEHERRRAGPLAGPPP